MTTQVCWLNGWWTVSWCATRSQDTRTGEWRLGLCLVHFIPSLSFNVFTKISLSKDYLLVFTIEFNEPANASIRSNKKKNRDVMVLLSPPDSHVVVGSARAWTTAAWRGFSLVSWWCPAQRRILGEAAGRPHCSAHQPRPDASASHHCLDEETVSICQDGHAALRSGE